MLPSFTLAFFKTPTRCSVEFWMAPTWHDINIYPHTKETEISNLKSSKSYNYSHVAAKYKIKQEIKDAFVSVQEQAIRQPITHLQFPSTDRSINPSISQLANQLISLFD